MFLNLVQFGSEPSDYATLKYPNLVDHDLAFGENPFYQLNSNQFVYSFAGTASDKYVYYTMAVYQHNWGLTNFKKSAYQIRVTADISSSPSVQSSRPPVESVDAEPVFITG